MKNKLMVERVSVSLAIISVLLFVIAVGTNNVSLAFLAISFCIVSCGIITRDWGTKTKRMRLTISPIIDKQIFPALSEDTALIVTFYRNTNNFQFNAFRRTHDGLVENNTVLLHKSEAINLRDMLDRIIGDKG
ncbi:MAG: hypothetical protein ACRDBG_28000 [Waterburya sp.]